MKMPVRIGIAILAISSFAVPLALPSAAGDSLQQPQAAVVTEPGAVPTALCPLVDFDTAQFVWDPVTGHRVLEVQGVAGYAGMQIELAPLAYVRQPEFWAIQVTGCAPGTGLSVMTPYTATLDIDEYAPGRQGADILGRNQDIRLSYTG